MPQQLISNINGIDIVTVEQEGEVYVPIKPICDAIGIDPKVQRCKLQEDEFFASTGVIMTSVAADDKERGIRRARLNELLLECYNKAKAHKDTRTMERVSEAYGKLNPQIRFFP